MARPTQTSAPNLRQQQADATRAKIIAAAVAIVDEKGEAALRVADVSERAGVSTPAIYHYFDGRDDLVVAVRVEQYLTAVGTDVQHIAAVVENAQDGEELVRMMREVSRAASAADRADHRWRRAEILGAARRRPELAAQLAQSQHGVNAELARIAKVGQERGLFDPSLDATAMGIFVQAFTFGLLLADVDPDLGMDATAWLDVVSRFTAAVTPAGSGLTAPEGSATRA